MPTIRLPTKGGRVEDYATKPPRKFPKAAKPFNRVAYAAAHVVADPLADNDPWLNAAIDWETTLKFRSHLFSLGLAVAEAMDTAQRGMGLDWPTSLELIQRSVALAKAEGGTVASGAGTDHLAPAPSLTLSDVIAAYEEQCTAVEKAGGRIILMASRALAACAKSQGAARPAPMRKFRGRPGIPGGCPAAGPPARDRNGCRGRPGSTG